MELRASHVPHLGSWCRSLQSLHTVPVLEVTNTLRQAPLPSQIPFNPGLPGSLERFSLGKARIAFPSFLQPAWDIKTRVLPHNVHFFLCQTCSPTKNLRSAPKVCCLAFKVSVFKVCPALLASSVLWTDITNLDNTLQKMCLVSSYCLDSFFFLPCALRSPRHPDSPLQRIW